MSDRDLADEVEMLRQELAEANGRADATRAMAIGANATLRALLLSALNCPDDDRTSLSAYVAVLQSEREHWRPKYTKLAVHAVGMNDAHRRAVAALEAELASGHARAVAGDNAYRLMSIERDDMRPVVDAARTYVKAWHGLDRFRSSDGDDLGRLADAQHLSRNSLVTAVDAMDTLRDAAGYTGAVTS